jgi:hypothetical protein
MPAKSKSATFKYTDEGYQRDLLLCKPSPKPKNAKVDPAKCFLLNMLNVEIRKAIYQQSFQDPTYRFEYRAYDKDTFRYNYPYFHHLLRTCRTIYDEAVEMYYTHSQLALLGLPGFTVPKQKIRQYCQQVLVQDHDPPRNFGQLQDLKRILVGGPVAAAPFCRDKTGGKTPERTDEYLLGIYREEKKELLADAWAIEHSSGAKVVVLATLQLITASGLMAWVRGGLPNR